MCKIEQLHSRLIAFYPVYTEQGNMSRLLYMSDEPGIAKSAIDPRQVDSVKKALARCYAIDLAAQVGIMREKYQRRILLHFYLPDGRVFIPFKLRDSLVKGDACYGYVDMEEVVRLISGDEPQLLLKCGESLKLYSNLSTASLAYFIGLEIQSDFVDLRAEPKVDLVSALTALRGVFAGEPKPLKSYARRLRIKNSK